jgi:hypothetical protein
VRQPAVVNLPGMMSTVRAPREWRRSREFSVRRQNDGGREKWCPGTESNRRHRDFQSRALPTELPGLSRQGRPPVQAPRSLPFAFLAVHPGWIGSWTGNAIALIEPAQQVAILAAARAERGVLRSRRLTANGTGLGIRSLAHMAHGWGATHRFARSPRRRLGAKAARSRQDAAPARG